MPRDWEHPYTDEPLKIEPKQAAPQAPGALLVKPPSGYEEGNSLDDEDDEEVED